MPVEQKHELVAQAEAAVGPQQIAPCVDPSMEVDVHGVALL